MENIDTGSKTGASELAQRNYRIIEDVSGDGNKCDLGVFNSYCNAKYVVHADCGASAGYGGKGGLGGRAGLLKLFELGSKPRVVLREAIGQNGAPGAGGKYGGNPQEIELKYRWHNSVFDRNTRDWTVIERRPDKWCSPIRPSSDGVNSVGIQQPEPKSHYTPSIPINEFQSFTAKNMNNILMRGIAVEFDKLIRAELRPNLLA